MHARTPLFTAAVVFAISMFVATFARAQCPSSTLSCYPVTSSQQAIIDLVCPNDGGVIHINLITGMFSASGSGSSHGGRGEFTAMDRYTLSGLPAGTPATITAKLHLTGSTASGCVPLNSTSWPQGTVSGGFYYSGTYNTVSVSSPLTQCSGASCCTGPASMNQDVTRSISCLAGQAFDLGTTLFAGASGGGSNISGTLTFESLPAGASIVSCQGFTQSAPVAANATSWGKLKQIYR